MAERATRVPVRKFARHALGASAREGGFAGNQSVPLVMDQ